MLYCHEKCINNVPNWRFSIIESSQESKDFPLKFEEKDLRERLTPQQYDVTQNQGTER